MYKLAETFIKKESQWQAPAAALPPLAIGLGTTAAITAGGLTYDVLKNNPTDFKKWQTIPTTTAVATGLAAKKVYDWGKDAINSVGNFVAPKKPTISNTLPNQPGLLSSPKPLNWTNEAVRDNIPTSKALVKYNGGTNNQDPKKPDDERKPLERFFDGLKNFTKKTLYTAGGIGAVGVGDALMNFETSRIKNKGINQIKNEDKKQINLNRKFIDSVQTLPKDKQKYIIDSLKNVPWQNEPQYPKLPQDPRR